MTGICKDNNAGIRYSVAEIDTYPTVIYAITIFTSLVYGWTSDLIKLRSPIVFFSLAVCFFAAINLAVWDGVPTGLKWASYYLTGFAPGSGPIFLTMVNEVCAGDSLERILILGSTNSVAYAFNAWIPLLSYDTVYEPRFLVGNSITVGLIVCAAITLSLAVYLERRDKAKKSIIIESGASSTVIATQRNEWNENGKGGNERLPAQAIERV